MIKLVLYSENYSVGGVEHFIFDLLKCDLFDIYLIINRENIRIIDFAQKYNIKYKIINLSGKRFKNRGSILYNRVVKILNFFIYYGSMIPNYFKIKDILKELKDYKNIIIVNGGYPAGLSSLSASVASKKSGYSRVGLSILSSPSPYYKNIFFKYCQLKIDKFVDKHIDFYIPNSKKIKSELVEIIGIEIDKIEVIYTGIKMPKIVLKRDTLRYKNINIKKDSSEVWILMVGLLGSTKRQDILIEAVSKLDKNFKLILAGDGNNRDVLESMVLSLGIEDRVLFLGWIDNAHDVYLFSDIVVFVSNHEGLPYVISEAMSYKIPIIASDVGGVSEQIIDNIGGILLDSNSSKELSKKIEFLSKNGELIDKYTKYSFKRVNRYFSIDTMNQKILELYKGVV